jgi:polysaccharide export outer membrane protein
MRLSSLAIALVLAIAVGGTRSAFAQPADPQASAASPTPAESAPPGTGVAPLAGGEAASGSYILGRDDIIQVGLLGRSDFALRARVQADGTIQLPLVGKIVAGEHTTSELAEVIRKALQSGGYYADPIVNIEVVSFASRYVTVLGAFGNSGLIPMSRPYRLSELLAKVGGVREGAADYIIVRSLTGKEKHYTIRELATGDLSQDPFVQAGDKLYAPPAELFYVYGAVKAPGVFPISGDTTLRMALVRAGGVTDQGSDKKAEVTRGGKTITLDAAAKVLPGDVVFIKEKLF